MGDTPEAIEGQAKLFRVLSAYAKYNPQIGYSQGDGAAPTQRSWIILSQLCASHADSVPVYAVVMCNA